MKVTIEINMDNAAFDDGWASELHRILSGVPDKIDHVVGPVKEPPYQYGGPPHILPDNKLLDVNGNTVGFVKFER